jgi:hypothetical protein
MSRISAVVVVLFLGANFVAADDKDDEDKAKLSCDSLLQACLAFKISPADGMGKQFPTVLLELAKPPNGRTSYLKNGEKDLIDPWGKTFQYAVAKDEKGELQAYVWTERTVGGKTKVIGTKPPEPKK